MTDQPEAPADPVSAEDNTYAAIVSEFRGLRRAGAGILAASFLTAAYRVALAQTSEE